MLLLEKFENEHLVRCHFLQSGVCFKSKIFNIHIELYCNKTHVLKVYCQINLLTHINTLIVRDVTLNKISLVHFHD